MAKAYPEATKIASAVSRATRARLFEKRGDAWLSIVKDTNSGHGSYEEDTARAQHHRLIGFDALKRLGYDADETHEFDWHLWPTETARAFVDAAIAAHKEVADARASRLPFDLLVRAVIQGGRRA
jgi:hypothetical protein